VALICFLLPVVAASAAEPEVRVTSTVRADSRTGRLVRRTTVVTPSTVSSSPVRPVALASRDVTPRVLEPTPAVQAAQTSRMLHNVDVNQVVEQTARANEVDPLLVHSLIRAESNYNPGAVSPKGAMGLMQLMPGTARRFGAMNTFDVRQNIEAGVKYLRYLQGMFRGDDRLALAAYNAGEGAVLRYGDVPPYRETENYVYKVGKSYGEALKRQRPSPLNAETNQAAVSVADTPAAEPLRQLEIARDAEGRIVLRTR